MGITFLPDKNAIQVTLNARCWGDSKAKKWSLTMRALTDQQEKQAQNINIIGAKSQNVSFICIKEQLLWPRDATQLVLNLSGEHPVKGIPKWKEQHVLKVSHRKILLL